MARDPYRIFKPTYRDRHGVRRQSDIFHIRFRDTTAHFVKQGLEAQDPIDAGKFEEKGKLWIKPFFPLEGATKEGVADEVKKRAKK